MTTTIDLAQSQPTLTELLELTAQGKEVLLVSGGKSLATLRATPESNAVGEMKPRTPGLQPNSVTFLSDDWDDPLPDEFWLGGE